MSNQNKLSGYCRHKNVKNIEALLNRDLTLDVLPEENVSRFILFLVDDDHPLWSTAQILLQYHIDNRLNALEDKKSDEYLHNQAKLGEVLEYLQDLDGDDLDVPESVYKLCQDYVEGISDDVSESGWDGMSLPDNDALDVMGSDATDLIESAS